MTKYVDVVACSILDTWSADFGSMSRCAAVCAYQVVLSAVLLVEKRVKLSPHFPTRCGETKRLPSDVWQCAQCVLSSAGSCPSHWDRYAVRTGDCLSCIAVTWWSGSGGIQA